MANHSLMCNEFLFRARNDTEYLPVTPNPDVAGVGVIVAFTASAYLTLFLVFIYYGSDCVPKAYCNAIDRALIRRVSRWPLLSSIASSNGDAEPMLRRAVLLFSDQQLVTGLAILGSGYSQLTGNISSYHWQIIVYLAWFSSLTHLTTLTIIRDFFRRHAAIRNWRLFFMLLSAAMLIAALLPTGDSDWLYTGHTYGGYFSAGVPAICYFKRLGSKHSFSIDQSQGPSMLVSILVLAFGYLTRGVKLSNRASAVCRLWLRSKPSKWLYQVFIKAEPQSDGTRIWDVKCVILYISYMNFRATFDFFESMLWEIIWLAYALLWGSLKLFLVRTPSNWTWNLFASNITLPSDDNVWNFGQCLVLILLALPLLSLGESYLEHINTTRLQNQRQEITVAIPLTRNASDAATGMRSSETTTMLRMGFPKPAQLLGLQDLERSAGTSSTSGTVIANNEQGFKLQPSMPSEASQSISTGSASPVLQNPYQYEWYRLLILMIGVHTSTIIICLIASFAMASWFQIATIATVFRSIGWMVFAMVVWTTSCVLAEALQPLIMACTTRLPHKIREVKNKFFRILWLIWYTSVFCGVAFLIITSVFPYVAPVTNRGVA